MINEKIISELILELEDNNFKCCRDKENGYLICETRSPFVPIDDFITFFEKMGEIIEKYKIEKFIFDKRSLRAFHQPTMEWYFVEWKQKLMKFGLTVHRKILPQEEWFKKAVEAGRANIQKSYPEFPFDKLDIQYFDSIEECVRN